MFVLANRRLSPVPPLVVWLVLALGVVAASITLNRTMWPALGAAAIVFMLVHNAQRPQTTRSRLIALVLVVVIVAISTSQFLIASTIKRYAQSTSQGVATAVMRDERIEIWKYALMRTADRPLYGYGYGRGVLRKDFRARMGYDLAWHAHNAFLNHTLSLGIPGLVAFCLMLAGIGFAFCRLARRTDPLTRSLGAFGLALLVSMVVRSLADDTIVRENALLFWSLVGMALGVGTRREGQ
jgi:O-antigen ligase